MADQEEVQDEERQRQECAGIRRIAIFLGIEKKDATPVNWKYLLLTFYALVSSLQ